MRPAVAHRAFDARLIAAVVAQREPADVGLADAGVVHAPYASVETQIAVAGRVVHEERYARIAIEVGRLRARRDGVEHDLVAVEDVPHDREVRRARRADGAEHTEVELLEERALLGRERHQRKRSFSAGLT